MGLAKMEKGKGGMAGENIPFFVPLLSAVQFDCGALYGFIPNGVRISSLKCCLSVTEV